MFRAVDTLDVAEFRGYVGFNRKLLGELREWVAATTRGVSSDHASNYQVHEKQENGH